MKPSEAGFKITKKHSSPTQEAEDPHPQETSNGRMQRKAHQRRPYKVKKISSIASLVPSAEASIGRMKEVCKKMTRNERVRTTHRTRANPRALIQRNEDWKSQTDSTRETSRTSLEASIHGVFQREKNKENPLLNQEKPSPVGSLVCSYRT